MRITTNFFKSEFDSKDGSEMPKEVLCNVIKLAGQLQILRDHFDAPITINSGYRSPEHNKKVGGASRSQHLYGKAADIVVKGVAPQKVYETIEMLIKQGDMLQGGLGNYKTFTHYDIRKNKARW